MHTQRRPRPIALRPLNNEASDDELDALLSDSVQDHEPPSGTSVSSILPRKLPEHNLAQKTRRIALGQGTSGYPSNLVSNAKYSLLTFIPLTLFEQFKFFFNLYFLLVALSQFIPSLRIGFLSTYIAPLVFVLVVTMAQEASDDLARRRRDNEANAELYEVLGSSKPTMARNLKVGDIIRVHKDRRLPADVILLHTEDDDGGVFIRTDQLDGETDWKLKTACSSTQGLASPMETLSISGYVITNPPMECINTFNGTLSLTSPAESSVALTIENALWANTVLASESSVLCLVVYTGAETRQSLNTSRTRLKSGLLEQEINSVSKVLCAFTFLLSFALVGFHGFRHSWYVDVVRFLILFSTIIPISLRVNLDLGKNVYAHQIEHDNSIAGTIVRTSTIPEDLGRIEYLLTDKTGTLTRNEMEMKKLHVGTVSYSGDAMEEIVDSVKKEHDRTAGPASRSRREISARVRDVVLALAVCHNVTPSTSIAYEDIQYQAASPDELAIVKWASSVGLRLVHRDRKSITLVRNNQQEIKLEILHVFPFTSESKRMSIITRDERGVITFFQKGADVVMSDIVGPNDWLEEECGNMAREGLRTLVVGKKTLSKAVYQHFLDRFVLANGSLIDRDEQVSKVVADVLEQNLELLGLTGVEDRLQSSVKIALEFLRHAGIKIWMLTGDKVETAKCIAISAKLVGKSQYIHSIVKLADSAKAMAELEVLQSRQDIVLLLDGESLQFFLNMYRKAFVEAATRLPAVICCRCAPTQKADVARVIREYTNKRVACIGDGGNDVSMIQAADIGIGIPGKEGRQASLAADFSVPEFHHLMKLLVWHGRNSYKRSAKLAQFVIHRGLVISICQIVYSIASKFAPIALFQGWLMVGYATIYTMMPVFSLALDCDLDESLALLYPELYKDLTRGRSLSYKTFLGWVLVSVYQGLAIMLTTFLLQGHEDSKMVMIAFSALVMNELIMVALEVNTWHKIMVCSELASITLYIASFPLLGDYFDLDFVTSLQFYWKTALALAISLIPPWAAKKLQRKISPPDYAKVAGNV